MVYLRELSVSDVAQINRWRQDRELMNALAGPFRFVSIESDLKWFESYLQERSQNVRLAICKESDNTHIGNVYLLGIDPVHRTAEFHIFIGQRNEWGKGYGEQATLLCLQHGFMDINLHRVELSVLTTNQRAIKMYEKCGFAHEGTARKAAFKNGSYVDVCRMAALRGDVCRMAALHGDASGKFDHR